MELISGLIHIVQYYLLPFVVVLGVMIFIHEMGHFLLAKLFGVKVLKFALGFGPIMVGRTFGETEYSIRYFPLGGFVKMLGEDIESETVDAPAPLPEEEERYFNKKHPLKRIAIVIAGPLFNLLLALLIFWGDYWINGVPFSELVTPPEISAFSEDSPAREAGLRKGDAIVSIQNKKVEKHSEIKEVVEASKGVPLLFEVIRNGESVRVTVTPKEIIDKNMFGEDIKSVRIGIVFAERTTRTPSGPLHALRTGFDQTIFIIKLTFRIVKKLFEGVLSIKALGGPIQIGQITGQIAQQDLRGLIPFMALISISLGILNLFPVPILDGGLIVFLLIEWIKGKPLGIRTRETAMKIGLALLIFLMLIVTYNDIIKLINDIMG